MTLVSTEGFDSIVNAIYRAGLDPTAWDSFISTLCDTTAGQVYWGLHGYDRVTNEAIVVTDTNLSPDAVADYVAYYGDRNPWLPAAMNLPSGAICDGRDLVAEENLFRTEFYNDWLLPQENISIGSGAMIYNDPARVAMIAANIRRKDEDRLQSQLTSLLRRLAPHLERAVELNRAIHIERASHCLNNPNAAFVLARDGSPIASSPSGAKMMQSRDLLSQDRHGQLRFADRRAQASFERALAAIAAGGINEPPSGFRAETVDERSVTCMLSPTGGATVPISDAQTIFSPDLPAVVLVIIDPSSQPHLCREALIAAFGLTHAEAALAEALTTGASLAEIAEMRQVSKHTVRNQLKSLFQKTGTSRQGALIALLARFLPA